MSISVKTLMNDIMELFPLPSKPPEYCHDEFLKKILPKSTPIQVKKVGVTTETPITNNNVEYIDDFDAKLYRVDYAARATVYMSRMSTVHKSSLSLRQRDSILITTEMFKTRFANLISDFSSVCIIVQLLQLKEFLRVMQDLPPEGTDPNKTIFGWCYKEKLKRFEEESSAVIIDIMENNKSENTLDELKFYVDLGELIRLVEVLIKDVSSDSEYNQLAKFNNAISNTTMDIDKIIALPYETQMAVYKELFEESRKKNRRFHNEHLARKQLKLSKIESELYNLSPIATRYKINWVYDRAEQAQFYCDQRCKNYQDKLEKIRDLRSKDMSVWDSVYGKYRTLIESYKQQILSVQQEFENDMETAENMVQITRNRVNKCKDDLSHAQETVKMFKRRVQEVLDKIAEQKELERIAAEKLEAKIVNKSDKKRKNKKG
ncbi:uncharacterized protein Dana_GF24318 [Drosophila ananassae]|uniref:Uncharacterized protein n=1 Tax=Drosophila ananassae TaxID=7217 RepID=B3MU89_DROAN|nr:uncharacterized protein LOC6506951 [Drosophila ananassae]EDV33418.2 uncharacterized protein Dana_GF24318 [Drosophila ananassae]